jgi:hypothetical protein
MVRLVCGHKNWIAVAYAQFLVCYRCWEGGGSRGSEPWIRGLEVAVVMAPILQAEGSIWLAAGVFQPSPRLAHRTPGANCPGACWGFG